ncbi:MULTISPECIES: BetR domain protein [Mammaliicoccus]|uniref:BetR domain protein n=1 Tax=Mammaliicoccus TaxID=2803850 RepID=UPI00107161E7|nr:MULTISPECIES: BetR domain protein [Mammaliicoccus]MBF0793767.1 BetR domain protein [Mammaliicoccus lentus]TFV17070.1 BetR domain protein [Mammaliicoccus lentus]
MHPNKLKSHMALKGISVNELLNLINEKGVKMSRNSFYRRMNKVHEFDRAEILAIVEILKLSEEEMLDIFFKQ